MTQCSHSLCRAQAIAANHSKLQRKLATLACPAGCPNALLHPAATLSIKAASSSEAQRVLSLREHLADQVAASSESGVVLQCAAAGSDRLAGQRSSLEQPRRWLCGARERMLKELCFDR